MNGVPLTREALSSVLESLLRSELASARGGSSVSGGGAMHLQQRWTDDLHLGEEGSYALGCDSLDRMRLAAATNEMFHLYEVEEELAHLSEPTFGSWLNAIQAAWRKGVSRITFSTSGSTGTPTRCTHDFTHLQTEVRFLKQRFAERSRVVLLAPPHHIYGFLFGAMLPEALAVEVNLATMGDGGMRPSGLFRAGDLVVSFPEQWRWLERTVPHWPQDICGVVSTAPCPPDLIAALHERGLQEMIEVYGSSETAGVGLRSWPQVAYRFMPHWQVVALHEESGTELLSTSGLRVRLMDRLRVDGEGNFTLGGRIDGAVQIGGTNVYPARVAARLRTHPQVSDAAVRLMRREEGSRLKAFIVAEADVNVDVLRRELEVWCVRNFRSPERPTAFTFGDCLPKNPLGKASDW